MLIYICDNLRYLCHLRSKLLLKHPLIEWLFY